MFIYISVHVHVIYIPLPQFWACLNEMAKVSMIFVMAGISVGAVV